MSATEVTPARRTKRRYAHELYPHGEEGESRSLEVEVPCLYARWVGLELEGTSAWDGNPKDLAARLMQMIDAQRIALLADALDQGMVGQEAWDWVSGKQADESGESAWERMLHHGIDHDLIKPYPCGPEPEWHEHLGAPDNRGFRLITRIPLRESDCAECTEPVEGGE